MMNLPHHFPTALRKNVVEVFFLLGNARVYAVQVHAHRKEKWKLHWCGNDKIARFTAGFQCRNESEFRGIPCVQPPGQELLFVYDAFKESRFQHTFTVSLKAFRFLSQNPLNFPRGKHSQSKDYTIV